MKLSNLLPFMKHVKQMPIFGVILMPLFAWAQPHISTVSHKITPVLKAEYQRHHAPDVLVIFNRQADLTDAHRLTGKQAKAAYVLHQLQACAEHAQQPVRALLRAEGVFFNSFYLVNAIAVRACPQDLAWKIARFPEVVAIAPDPDVYFEGANFTQNTETVSAPRGQIEWGVQRVNAPALWALNIRGQGTTVGGADTGYDWIHPALKNTYRGYYAPTDTFNHNYNWYDAIHEASPLNSNPNNPCGFNATSPCDDNAHGTHTMGTMTGFGGDDHQIGVAPAARWVGCRNMERGWGKPSTYIECFEWFLAPTDTAGKHPRPEMAPHVVNNSWYCADVEGCVDISVDALLHKAVQNLRASGVVVVASNGNFGPGCATGDYPPAYFEESFSVGATREDGRVANFSSRGPVRKDGSGRVKPNVCAPGQSVRSCVPGGEYARFSGTSMAGPHVAGVVALLISAYPELAGEVDRIENLIEKSARFMPALDSCWGIAGGNNPNHVCGFGEVDAWLAYQLYKTTREQTAASWQADVWVFPNPSSDVLYISAKNVSEQAIFQLFDAGGRRVFQQRLEQGEQQFRLHVSHIPRGLYFWKLSTAAGKVLFH